MVRGTCGSYNSRRKFGVLQNLTPEDFGLTAYVDEMNIVAKSIRLPVRLQYKEIAGIESVVVEPLTVKVLRKTD